MLGKARIQNFVKSKTIPPQRNMIRHFGLETLCWTSSCANSVTSNRVEPYRTVSFSKRVRIEEIPNTDSFSQKQRKELWYPEPKRPAGRFNILQSLRCLQRDERDDTELRILQREERKIDTKLPIDAVLSEQEIQREYGSSYDPTAIAKVYHRCSAYSAVRAQIRALEFELVAQEYQRKPLRRNRSNLPFWKERDGIV